MQSFDMTTIICGLGETFCEVLAEDNIVLLMAYISRCQLSQPYMFFFMSSVESKAKFVHLTELLTDT